MTIRVETAETVYGTEKPEAAKSEKSAPEAKATEQNDASESDTEAKDAKDQKSEAETDAEDETESEESEADESQVEDAKPKKKGGFQRRIDKLNAAKADAQREAEYWKRLATEKSAGETKKEPVETKADQSGKPDPEKFDSHADYVEALTDWKVGQSEKAREAKANEARALTEREKAIKAHIERKEAFAKKTADFEEALEKVDDIQFSEASQKAIIESELGPEIMYALANDRKEAERIAALPPEAVLRAIGRLEGKLSASAPASQETKKITKASKPLEPVGSSGKSIAPKSLDDPNITQKEFERIRRDQMKSKAAGW